MQMTLLPRISSPADLQRLSKPELLRLADEIREALCHVVSDRTAHFASNLGVVELCLALHLAYDFSKDRLIWDTGHQIYPHKLITGRFHQFPTIRQRHGLMGFPNPAESEYDLFMTGHAGASVSTALGLKAGDDLMGESGRRSVAVIGDGALPSGVVFEAMNNAAELKKNFLVILNDNEMGICPRVGGLAKTLDKARTLPFYNGLKRDVSKFLNALPLVGESAQQTISQFKDAVKGFFHGGMLFEEMGFKYIGPVDGHDLHSLRQYLEMVRDVPGPVLLHVLTQKGHGFRPACEDPVTFHAPPPFQRDEEGEIVSIRKSSSRAYTNSVSDAIYGLMKKDEKVAVLTAAMCEGNKLGRIRDEFPTRFFDTGICESHTVAFAAGMAKAGMKPIVDIYSTFLQRSFDHIFQEVALQNLPVVFAMDRAGIAGPDGPTHHGVFDISYTRIFPNMIVMAPGDESEVEPMVEFAVNQTSPVALRYPKANVETIPRQQRPIELGKADVHRWGRDGMFVAYGTLFSHCVRAAEQLREAGFDVGVINARFAKPLDTATLLAAVQECPFVITVEENTVQGGFGSAVLEAASTAKVAAGNIHVLGIPDRFVPHGERDELLAEIGLDVPGLVRYARGLLEDAEIEPAALRA